MEKQKEYNLRSLLAKVCTTWGKASDRLRQMCILLFHCCHISGQKIFAVTYGVTLV
jgi:hypothetical protein